MVENSAMNMQKPKNNNVTSKPTRRPNPWAGESMFRKPPNSRQNMKPLPVYLPRLQRTPKPVPVPVPKNPKTIINQLKYAALLGGNVVKSGVNIGTIITNTSKNMNERKKRAQNVIDRFILHFKIYMESNGPSSGAAKIFAMEAFKKVPVSQKARLLLVALAAVYGSANLVRRHGKPFATWIKNHGKRILPFATMALKAGGSLALMSMTKPQNKK